MYRYVFIAAMLTAVLPSGPCFAVSAQQKMVTCKFGADDQKLEGKARGTFMKKCMSNKDDPRGQPVPSGAAAVPPPPKQ